MDRRVKYTKKVIKETLIHLMEEKDITKITITEICEIADINRATFYRYYLDVNDLLEKIEEEFFQEIKEASSMTGENYSVASFSKEILQVFLNNKSLVRVLFYSFNCMYFLNDLLELVYEKCKTKWISDIPDLSTEEAEYASVFIFNGALGIVYYWIKNDFDKDVEEISQLIEKLSYYGTMKFIYKR